MGYLSVQPDPDVEAEFKAESLFLRALYTFEAWLVFGDRIPILTLKTIKAAVGNASKISNDNPPHAVLNQIIDDLTYVVTYIGPPRTW